jgi:catechol 2,3-dioxygenase-like lactoylglutathione lyase family enzyme
MYDRVTIGVADLGASRRFYATVLGVLGHAASTDDPDLVAWGDVAIAPAGGERPVTTGLHLGVVAQGTDHVRAFWQAGVDAGFRDDGAPGPRPQYGPDYVGAFLLDPDGNSAEAVVHGGLRADGVLDHLWVRVRDVAASTRFYATIAGPAGFRAVAEEGDLTRFSPGPRRGSLSVVAGERVTTPFHLTFGVGDHAAVQAVRAAAIGAGYAEHGAPGAHAASVRDPDGHVVEAVAARG